MPVGDSLVQLLEQSVARHPGAALHYPVDGTSQRLRDLADQSRVYAWGLRARGVRRGDPVGLFLPTGAAFFAAFFGLLRLGAVPVPLPTQIGFGRSASTAQRLAHIIADAGILRVVVETRLNQAIQPAGVDVEPLTTAELTSETSGLEGIAVAGDDLAFIQYSSGSISAPRGVALSHGNVLAGIEAIARGMQATSRDICWLWLPLFHDMGLVSALTGIAVGYEQHLWPPSAFIRRPERWFAQFAATRATIYVGPNFSYEYLLASVGDALLNEMDLSRWRIAFNGAELIDGRVMLGFIERFGRAGFRAESMFPVYGLAEATLAVTFPALGSPPVLHWVDRDVLARERRVHRLAPDHPRARGVVSVGHPVFRHEVRIADDDGGAVLPEGRVGEIHVRGPAVMRAYHRAPAQTRAAFCDGWLRTGDLGYLEGGQLFVVGRLKEVLVVRGLKYHPEDVEAVVRELPGIYRQRCVAFPDTGVGAEGIGLAVETSVSRPDARAALAAAISTRIGAELGVGDCRVYLVAPRSILRTSSGKYRRLGTAAAIQSGILVS